MVYLNRIRVMLLAAMLMACSVAFAMSLQEAMSALGQAKEQGLIGEQPNGYLGVVKNSGNAQQIVDLINQARRAEYKKLAESNGIAVTDVEALAGQKAIDRTQAGHYIFLNNNWTTK